MAASYRLRVPDDLEEFIQRLHPALKRKVRAGLDVIRNEPLAGKELRDDLAGLRSLRVGRVRLIYRVAPKRLIDLVALGPRRNIYEETLRLLRRETRTVTSAAHSSRHAIAGSREVLNMPRRRPRRPYGGRASPAEVE